MTETTCGNLRAMPLTLRQCRDSRRRRDTAQPRRRLRTRGSAWLLGVGLCLAAACDSTTKRDPVPNPTPAADDGAVEAKAAAPLDDDAAAERYLEIKAKFEADPAVLVGGPEFHGLKKSLEEITNGAGAKPLRANAALLLGAMVEVRGDSAQAAGFYEHAATLIPDDAGPFMALAVAHASAGNFTEAVKAQEDAARLDPDNLENWLALGELRMRAGDQDGSVQAYLAYEKRRKGLIDGLTLHDEQGAYVVDVDNRVACAESLAAAADQGTAVALVYALRSDPEAGVREAVARVMGIHRLEIYQPVLTTQSSQEQDAKVKESVTWALAEIARSPVKIDDTERPRLADDDPRHAEGEVPRAEAPAEAPTKDSTIAPAGAAPIVPGADAKGSAPVEAPPAFPPAKADAPQGEPPPSE